ncbi:MAG: aminotransferase class I/II-fold pyridoxal phosphate-dependent enzyme [Bacteroidales bacterium]|nr:aminotransferase class I/II-fold pyridoxal phosphate-dependent enzyme [Bacteroidales bacterium]
MKKKHSGFNTKLVHLGELEDSMGSVTVPIFQTSTFSFKTAQHGADCFSGKDYGYIYTRLGNPTINALEETIAELENGFGGIATSSGMGAVNSIYLALLGQGAHLVSTASVYGPSRNVIEKHYNRFGVEATFVDTSDPDNVRKSIKPNTKMILVETPSNPTMQLTDIRLIAAIAHEHGIPLVVDNTFSSPYLQNPLDLGADVVFHSITKFINGHADVVGGVIVAKEEKLYKQIRDIMVNFGCNMDPHQAYLVHRGVKTLSIRIEKAQENAAKIAQWLEEHPLVEWVKYPGLKSHPQHELAKKQMRGFGTMISFELKGGLDAGKVLMDNVELATLAVSLGGVETLIQHPASMTHSGVDREKKLKAGITDGLVRLSIGIEDVEDLIDDLSQAINKIS